jgi:hypothetical protein
MRCRIAFGWRRELQEGARRGTDYELLVALPNRFRVTNHIGQVPLRVQAIVNAFKQLIHMKDKCDDNFGCETSGSSRGS